jgi:hypothetical protein
MFMDNISSDQNVFTSSNVKSKPTGLLENSDSYLRSPLTMKGGSSMNGASSRVCFTDQKPMGTPFKNTTNDRSNIMNIPQGFNTEKKTNVSGKTYSKYY